MGGGNNLSDEDYRIIFVQNSHLLDALAFDKLVQLAQQTNRALEPLLIEHAFISQSQFLELAAAYFKIPAAELKISNIKQGALRFLAAEDALNSMALPFDFDDKELKVAVVNPRDQDFKAKLHNEDQLEVKIFITTEQALRRALILYDSDIEAVLTKLPKPGTDSGDGTLDASQLIISIIEAALIYDASDVHIEPYEDTIIVRLRVDGLLRRVANIPTQYLPAIVSNLKVLASLRIDESRRPQDGRFSLSIKGQEVNVRLSLVPSLWGEKVVLRILPKEAHLYDLNNLGLLDSDIEIIKDNLRRPFGMILVCGPTGSGKTTTLYAFLQEIGINRIDVVNISTIEDPIEYTIPRVTQIQTSPGVDLSFANGLRAILRQDPDIIMVGEIRDEETADVAVRAALVGRLMLSSVHTNDAIGVIPRLLDMGVEPYLVFSTLSMVVAQRLARKLCTYCRQSYPADAETLQLLEKSHDLKRAMNVLQKAGALTSNDPTELRFFKSVGCNRCDMTGYVGRSGLYEIMEITDDIRANFTHYTDADALKNIAVAGGMKTMFEDGLAKVTLGIIDIKELLRVVYD